MGLFGLNKEGKAMQGAMFHIQRILEDEDFQNKYIPSEMRDLVVSGSVYDIDPNGTGAFGYIETNPIPVNGPLGEITYLSRLETDKGERIIFQRLGALNSIDVYEAVTFSGSEWFLFFMDFYHPKKSKITPKGFSFMDGLGQLSGFNKFSPDFPYDFVAMKQGERESGLSMAFIGVSKVTEQINARAFKRPLSHQVKLDLVNTKLISIMI